MFSVISKGVSSPFSKIGFTSVRNYKVYLPKARPRVKISQEGEISINTTRLEKMHRWKPERIDKMMKFVKRAYEDVKHLSEGDRMPMLQRELDRYMQLVWEDRMRQQKEAARASRRIRLKKRATTKLERKIRFWNKVQDEKERKVFQDQTREERLAKGETFSFRRFLKEQRELKQKPYPYMEQEAFEKYLEKQMSTNFFRGPVSSRQPMFWQSGYKRRFNVEIMDPLVYELRRKAYLTSVIQGREGVLIAKKNAEILAEQRSKRDIERAERHARKMAHFASTIGAWQAENERLKTLKREYFVTRRDIYAQARREFLLALDYDVGLWEQSPDECKYLRFKFDPEFAVKFPFNKSPYNL